MSVKNFNGLIIGIAYSTAYPKLCLGMFRSILSLAILTYLPRKYQLVVKFLGEDVCSNLYFEDEQLTIGHFQTEAIFNSCQE